MSLPIFQVDTFTSQLFGGNPAAVILMETFPDDGLLHRIAAENNVPETAFLVPDNGNYRLRWFTPTVEVPLCGHATLASAAVVMERLQPGRTTVTFDSASGPLTVKRLGERYVMNFPVRVPRSIPVPEGLAEALGIEPVETLDDGFNYIAVLREMAAVRSLAPDMTAIARLDRPGVVVTAQGDQRWDCVSRYFAPTKGIPEDPVTGGAHCGLAPYWSTRLGKRELRAFQASPRGGELTCRLVGDRVELEGACVFYLEGRIAVPVGL
ncbi:PhzF family phenazine biosynthesis protein [Telluria mixta]|uniref:PhzF family phenazine biosynthesis protein n=2 Tax=Telluria mixta TaxID=34071 RepID=A0ABT2BUZ9_9BURK|nr:PhzF family phenazine biosynthesis protein [Telluria mixta]MCS0628955.1 PhzF family phenazine biosynthesis protein [Telluria mixta]